MPIMAFFLVVFTMSSIGLPGLNGFVSEFLVLLGTFTSAQADEFGNTGPLGVWFAVPAATGILLGAIYMLHMVKCVVFGPLKEPGHGFDSSTGLTQDLTRREIAILAPIACLCLILGVYPKIATNVMEPSLNEAILARVFRDSTDRGPTLVARAESSDVDGPFEDRGPAGGDHPDRSAASFQSTIHNPQSATDKPQSSRPRGLKPAALLPNSQSSIVNRQSSIASQSPALANATEVAR
jgi:NADH-quinone oxidoreductase subunit M